MKPDINNQEYLEKLDRAINSPNGRILIDFLISELDKLSYEEIDVNGSVNDIGQNFLAMKMAREKINKILKFLTIYSSRKFSTSIHAEIIRRCP